MESRARLVTLAEAMIGKGSKSFAAASRLFDRTTRERVWLLYAWCRRCDDLIDGQDHGGTLGDQRHVTERLAEVRAMTAAALAGQPVSDPAFACLGVVAAETGLTAGMAEAVIAGFALDARGWSPDNEADLMQYCWHVAGAVGVMMAVVMGVDPTDEATLDRWARCSGRSRSAIASAPRRENSPAPNLPPDWCNRMALLTECGHSDATTR